MTLNNPFIISGYHSPLYFCDREKETNVIMDALHNERNITLIAPRRMGKTGLIKNVFYHLKEKDKKTITIYFDIFASQNLNDFVKIFANSVIGQLDSSPQKVFAKISDFFKSLRPSLSIDEISGKPKINIEIVPSKEESTLKEIFDYLSKSGKVCYIAIDEFQQISEYPEKGVEALLRSYIQFIPNVNWIFCGSRQHVMQEIFLSANKPFYLSTQIVNIEQINREQYYKFASSFFVEQKNRLGEDVFDYIYEMFDGHTWYVQNILNRLYSYNKNVQKEDVDTAILDIISEYEYSYQSIILAYPKGAVKLLIAIAKEGIVPEITAGDFIAKHNLTATSSVRTSLTTLIDKELVYRTPNGYIVYDRFMSLWMRGL